MPWVSGGWRLETLEASHNPKAPVGPSSVPQTGRVNRETWNQDSAAKGGEKEPHHPQLPEILFLSSACPVRRPSLGVSGLPSHQRHCHHGLTGSPLRFTETRQSSRTDVDRLVLPFFVAVILCLCVCLPHTDTPNTDLCVL